MFVTLVVSFEVVERADRVRRPHNQRLFALRYCSLNLLLCLQATCAQVHFDPLDTTPRDFKDDFRKSGIEEQLDSPENKPK